MMTKDGIIEINQSLSSEVTGAEYQEQSNAYKDNKLNMLRGLLDPAQIVNLKDSLKKGRIYKLVGERDLVKGKNGLYSGVISQKGKIVEHAKFEAVGVNITKFATTALTQVALVRISVQLDDLKKSIEVLSQDLERDRLAQIKTGMQLYKEACSIDDLDTRKYTLVNAVTSLKEGITKAVDSLNSKISNLPPPKNGLFDNIIISKSKQIEKKLDPLNQSYAYILEGLQYLAKAYTLLDEPSAARVAMEGHFDEISRLDIKKVQQLAAFVKACENKPLPEEKWQLLPQYENTLKNSLQQTQSLQHKDSFSIEFSYSEILKLYNYDKMSKMRSQRS